MWPYTEKAIRELQRRVKERLPLNHAGDFDFPDRGGWQEERARNGVLLGKKFVKQTPRRLKVVARPALKLKRKETPWDRQQRLVRQDPEYRAKEAARKRAERAAKPKPESKLGIRERKPFTRRKLPHIDWLESM